MDIRTASIDHLGLVCGFLDELDFVPLIDSLLPTKQSSSVLSHGEAVKGMILNGLGFVDTPLYMSPDYFEKRAVSHLFGRNLSSSSFNDATLGRTLDALYEYGVSEIYEEVASQTLSLLDIHPSHFHLDSTSFHLDGTYNSGEEKEENVVHLVPGYSRDHHPKLNQVVLNLIVENQSGIPLLLKVADGNQVDSNAFPKIIKECISSLKEASENALLTLDSAGYNEESLKVYREESIEFISRVPFSIGQAKKLQSQAPTLTWKTLDENYSYHTHEIEYKGIQQQWILYRSRASTKRESITLRNKIARESKKESLQLKKLQAQRFACETDAKKGLETFQKEMKWIQVYGAEIKQIKHFGKRGKPPVDAKPVSVEYKISEGVAVLPITTFQEKYEEECGYFILATNKKEISPEQLLKHYKEQQRVERGFRFLKSPDFLTNALYLKKPERIEALLMIMTLSLMVYSALEYKIRSILALKNETVKNSKRKPTAKPTTRWVFKTFSEIHYVEISALKVKEITNLSPQNEKLLLLIGKCYWKYYKC